MAKASEANSNNKARRKNKRTSIGKSANSRRIDKHGRREKKGHF